ncbi:MAG: hypothetical protein V3U75_05785 [Methylococcaceae bacterium]
MNEKEAKELIRSNYRIPKSLNMGVEKNIHGDSTIWAISVESDSNDVNFIIKQSDEDLSRQAELGVRAEKIFSDDLRYISLGVKFIPDYNVILSKRSELPTVSQLIEKNGFPNPVNWYSQTIQVVELAGNWLKAYHAVGQSVGSISEPLLRYVESREYIFKLFPTALKKLFLESVDSCPDHIISPIHCDFSPGNIFSNGMELSVIDFGVEEWVEMSPYWDIVTFIIAIERDFSFRYKSPLKWIPILRRHLLDKFSQAYGGDTQGNLVVWRVCYAVRHFVLLSSKVDSPITNQVRAWHIAEIEKILYSKSDKIGYEDILFH